MSKKVWIIISVVALFLNAVLLGWIIVDFNSPDKGSTDEIVKDDKKESSVDEKVKSDNRFSESYDAVLSTLREVEKNISSLNEALEQDDYYPEEVIKSTYLGGDLKYLECTPDMKFVAESEEDYLFFSGDNEYIVKDRYLEKALEEELSNLANVNYRFCIYGDDELDKKEDLPYQYLILRESLVLKEDGNSGSKITVIDMPCEKGVCQKIKEYTYFFEEFVDDRDNVLMLTQDKVLYLDFQYYLGDISFSKLLKFDLENGEIFKLADCTVEASIDSDDKKGPEILCE